MVLLPTMPPDSPGWLARGPDPRLRDVAQTDPGVSCGKLLRVCGRRVTARTAPMRQANAASLLGDEAAFRSAISRARREAERGPRPDDPKWIGFVDETEITGHEAMGVLNLRKPARGETLYRTVLDHNLSRRNRTYYGALLSGALLKQDAPEHAIAAGMNVLPVLADGVTSVRALDELRPLRTAGGPPTDERAAFVSSSTPLPGLWPRDDVHRRHDPRSVVPAF
jgi:hypothetical protein